MLICIDAGHYIGEPGKRCLKSIDPNETREWTLNSRIAEKVQALLAAYDCRTVRTDDPTGQRKVTLDQRVKAANDAKADVLVSIHHNAGIHGGSGGGIVVYIHPNHQKQSEVVQEAFTKSKENGAATDGLMATLTSITDRYASTSGDVKGILIEKAGSKYSPTAALDNTLLNQMKDVEEEISKWQDKMSNKVDYYTNKFTQLELLINQMNSQSYALAGLMGG